MLGDLDGDRTYEDRLALLVTLSDVVRDGAVLGLPGLVYQVVLVLPDHLPMGRYRDDGHFVDVHELVGLGSRRTGHARELVVLAEVVLDGDRSDRLILLLDRQTLL